MPPYWETCVGQSVVDEYLVAMIAEGPKEAVFELGKLSNIFAVS